MLPALAADHALSAYLEVINILWFVIRIEAHPYIESFTPRPQFCADPYHCEA
jgi:hypothetical protein